MKHAVMIMAHKNFEFLRHLIEYFSRDCYVFVHIDKKSSITREEQACLRAHALGERSISQIFSSWRYRNTKRQRESGGEHIW